MQIRVHSCASTEDEKDSPVWLETSEMIDPEINEPDALTSMDASHATVENVIQ